MAGAPTSTTVTGTSGTAASGARGGAVVPGPGSEVAGMGVAALRCVL